MGGGFMPAANSVSTSFSAATPPFTTARTFPTPGVFAVENGSIFGPAPSLLEVETAILQLQRFVQSLSSTKSEVEGIHGQMHQHQLKMMQSPGFIKFSEAFAMMQAEPPLQKLVTSLSCDEAVWMAILSNKAVDDLRASISTVKEEKRLSYPREADLAEVILGWILGFTKSKVLQLLENFASLVNEIFQPTPKEKPTSELDDLLHEKLRSSLLLSLVILIIVVFARSHD